MATPTGNEPTLKTPFFPSFLRHSEHKKHPNHIERNIVVSVITLDSLLRKYKMFCVDYCSIDVEGAEKSILKQFRFDDFDISVFSIENNSGNRDKSVQVILESAGYRLIEIIGNDEIYSR